jgi:hypothetical protein
MGFVASRPKGDSPGVECYVTAIKAGTSFWVYGVAY